MEYEIYIDSIFFSNFALNFLVLSLADKGFRILHSFKRRLFGSLSGAFVYCLLLVIPIPFMWGRVFIGSVLAGCIMSWCAFGVVTIEGLKRNLEEVLTYSFILGAAMFCLNRFFAFSGGVIGTLLGAVVSYEVIKTIRNKLGKEKQDCIEAKLYYNGIFVSAKTLLDTGNGLVEPISGKPVCVVRKETAMRLWGDLDTRGFRAIPYHSVGCSAGILKGYPIEQILVEYEGKRITISDIYVAVTEGMLGCRQDYDMIMNPKILENMCL